MAGIGSSSQSGQSVFSLDSQAGVMQLLAAIRASDLLPAHKNELRDLVFLYTNGGHDASVRLSLEQKVSEYKISPVDPLATSKATIESEAPSIGGVRRAPTFTVTQSTTAPVIPEPTPQQEPVTTAAHQPTPTEPSPATQPTTPEPVSVSVTPAATSSEPSVSPPQAPNQPAELAVPTSSLVNDSSLERVREIKAHVNQKVGNPVHLVDTNPELGREYMSALLEAMKKLNSGSSATTAMSRLEAAYEAIAALPDNLSSAPANEPSTPQPVVAPSSEPAASAVSEAPAQPSVPVADITSAASRASILDDDSTGQSANTQPRTTWSTQSDSVLQPVTKPTTPSQLQPQEPRSTVPPVVDTPAYRTSESTTLATDSVTNKVPIRSSQIENRAPSDVSISSTARSAFATDGHDETKVENQTMPKGVPITPQTTAAVPYDSLSNPLIKGKPAESNLSDPLQTTEIDSGLQQLLEEWPIFKKSGLFGTGPKGREHPLFKKVAGLQIPLLLAGRFEGATQEIKQSITDYMNGWRYEQGIIYQQGETFEHYLRRVIKHILDLQKNRM